VLVETITELERGALLSHVINLSDGHARQSLGEESKTRVKEVFDSFLSGAVRSDYFAAERKFLDNLTAHNGQVYTPGKYVVTYASSIAMTMVAALVKRERRRVGVVCPTFDNIPGLLDVIEVPVVPVPEEWLTPACDFERLDSLGIDAIVVVTPNNPTGTCLARATVCDLMDWASRRHVQVIIDLAFRWFEPAMRWDLIAEADARGADVITIDDTGKILSLSDLKVGVLSASRSLNQRIQAIHDQYVLNVSELTLCLLTAMMDPDREFNEIARALHIIGSNRCFLEHAIDAYNETAFASIPRPSSPTMSVQWLRLPGRQERIIEQCRTRGLEILPGRNFYWSTDGGGERHVRLAMMRDPSYFASGVDILVDSLNRLTQPSNHAERG
jgi:aspartate/methionine/tyrosine aminotransferase